MLSRVMILVGLEDILLVLLCQAMWSDLPLERFG
ncbi:hypothetical protein HNR48_003689 [Pseudoteredinibacter isoporae]|uniref:Uncharacterized protein n=1 Tax=Pseudoteredinibacter isoporae TaxID=570281 RepID=A0A7X0JWB1_9GAMM|nr:hypothetical protein [Pseudoteredinibacter isoporae]